MTRGRTARGSGVTAMGHTPMGITAIGERGAPPVGDIWFLRHDGTDPGVASQDRVVVPTWDAAPIQSNPSANDIRTVEAWVRLPVLPGVGLDAPLWTCGAGSNNADYSLLAQATTGDLVSNHWFNDPAWAAFWNTRLNTWGHLAVTYDGNVTECVYWNGTLVSCKTLVAQLATTRTDWLFYAMPSYQGGVKRLQLDMFDWRIWGATRTQPQIAANMGAFLTGTETDLMLNYMMQDGGGLTLLGQGNSYDPLTLNWADDATIDNTNARLSWIEETDPR